MSAVERDDDEDFRDSSGAERNVSAASTTDNRKLCKNSQRSINADGEKLSHLNPRSLRDKSLSSEILTKQSEAIKTFCWFLINCNCSAVRVELGPESVNTKVPENVSISSPCKHVR
jgi:hypothetical protein